MSAAAPSRPRLPSLTGLRWWAAFLVFGFHLGATPQAADAGGGLTRLVAPGASGVTFFFVLSGFVLTWSTPPGDRPLRFWRRRVARVLPSHVVVWVLVLLLLALGRDAVALGPALVGLVLGQAWVPDHDWYFAGNTPAWSLSCELAFYAAFPALVAVARRVPTRRLGPLALALVAAVWLVPAASLPMDGPTAYWFVWILPLTRVLDFALGVTLALLVAEGRWRGPGLAPSAALVVAALAAQQWVPERWGYVAWMLVPYGLLVAAAATADVTGRRSPLRHPWVELLGEVSFAFYLVHQPVIRAVLPLADGRGLPGLLAGALLALGLATVAAWLLHRHVERPLERLLSGRRRAAAAPVGAVLAPAEAT